MSKPACRYTPAEVYDLSDRLRAAAQTHPEIAELLREGSGVLLNQAIRLAQIRLTLEVKE